MSWVGEHVVESCVHRQAGGGLTPDHIVLDACTSREPKGWHQVSSFSRDFSGAGCGGKLCVSSAGEGIIIKHVLVMGCPRAKRTFFPNAVAPWLRLADAIRCLPPSPGSGPGACRPPLLFLRKLACRLLGSCMTACRPAGCSVSLSAGLPFRLSNFGNCGASVILCQFRVVQNCRRLAESLSQGQTVRGSDFEHAGHVRGSGAAWTCSGRAIVLGKSLSQRFKTLFFRLLELGCRSKPSHLPRFVVWG